jgi:putative transposase
MTIVDDYTRESLKIPVEKSITGMRVTQEISELIKIRGKPEEIVSDNGTEFICNTVLKWAQKEKVK